MPHLKFNASALSMAFAVLSLAVCALSHEAQKRLGRSFAFPIQVKDREPGQRMRGVNDIGLTRGFLTGWRLVLDVDYGAAAPYDAAKARFAKPRKLFKIWTLSKPLKAFLCMEGERKVLFSKPKDCSVFIRGYVQDKASVTDRGKYVYAFKALEDKLHMSKRKALRVRELYLGGRRIEIVVSVSKKGHALFQGLRVDGLPLESFL